jgi:hypothetical protein
MRNATILLLMSCNFSVLPVISFAQCRSLTAVTGAQHFNSMVLSESKLFGATNAGLFVSTNYGETWNEVTEPLFLNTDVRQLAVAGAHIYAATYGRGLFKSTDNGNNWSRLSLGYNALFFNTIAVSGSTLIASAGPDGIFVSTDEGNNWSRKNAPRPYDLMPTVINSSTEMRAAYKTATSNANACLLFSLAVIENNHNYMQEVKAGDMLDQSYRWAVQQNRGDLLLEIAQYENSATIMQERAGNILNAAYSIAMRQRNASLLFDIAKYENKAQMSDLKAGDVLANAYQYGNEQKDQKLLFDLARYEKEFDLITNTNAATILYNASQAAIANKDYVTLYVIAAYEADVDLLSNITSEDLRNRARIIQLGG